MQNVWKKIYQSHNIEALTLSAVFIIASASLRDFPPKDMKPFTKWRIKNKSINGYINDS